FWGFFGGELQGAGKNKNTAPQRHQMIAWVRG
ncbi:MAG: hypothetical protein ACI9DO_002391, partial [Reinekea sp.]